MFLEFCKPATKMLPDGGIKVKLEKSKKIRGNSIFILTSSPKPARKPVHAILQAHIRKLIDAY